MSTTINPESPDRVTIQIKLPPGTEQYEKDIRRFVDAMLHKLAVHANKGKWENMTLHEAYMGAKGELAELAEACDGGNVVEIMLEAADVANYALITASIAVER